MHLSECALYIIDLINAIKWKLKIFEISGIARGRANCTLIINTLGKETCEVLPSDTIVTTIVAHACKASLDSHAEIDLKKYASDNFNYHIPYSNQQ